MFSSKGYLLSFVLLTFYIYCCNGRIFYRHKVNLRIINEVGEGAIINFHCKSKDDDLGHYVLAPHQYFQFQFRPNLWGTTIFYCLFWWGNQTHWFDIYKESRDDRRCDEECWWKVGKSGACLKDYFNATTYNLCEDWKS